MLDIRETGLPGVLEVRPNRFGDGRGFFSETWSAAAMAEAGLALVFVQDNHSMSSARGVLRGLHFQRPPAAQDKLVRVTRGAVFDVAVDVRSRSPTFGRWVGVELSASKWNQLLIPKGFAHGFVTLEEESEVQYKVTAPYAPELERCVRWDDPTLAIDWPITRGLMLSDRDRTAPLLTELEPGFDD
jgi:dTDP-4-dehydrorhamnose 3,5-epimerase